MSQASAPEAPESPVGKRTETTPEPTPAAAPPAAEPPDSMAELRVLSREERLRKLVEDLVHLADLIDLVGLGSQDRPHLSVNDLLTGCRKQAVDLVQIVEYTGGYIADRTVKGLAIPECRSLETSLEKVLRDYLHEALLWLQRLYVTKNAIPCFRKCDPAEATAKLRKLAAGLQSAVKIAVPITGRHLSRPMSLTALATLFKMSADKVKDWFEGLGALVEQSRQMFQVDLDKVDATTAEKLRNA